MIWRLKQWRPQLAVLAGLVGVLILTWFVYRPGLSGPFLFDDYANLPALGSQGPINNAESLARYLTSGTADPTGRPIALASFLIDAQDWPAPPRPFKRTNVILHLLNGALLFAFLYALARKPHSDTNRSGLNSSWAALLASAMWMLHPLLVSTTLYVVQREAILATTFCLLGLNGWWHGRRYIVRGSTRTGLIIAVSSIVVFTLLGLLSKANGILLPVFVLVIEYTLAANPAWPSSALLPQREQRLYRWTVLSWCWFVAILIGAYLGWFVVRSLFAEVAAIRPWTLGQRLLTEPRVLWEYARLLALPKPYTAGVFNDQVQASTSFVEPWTTLPAIVGTLSVLGFAAFFRHRTPIISAAILFFACGHAIESTSIPLELYFEHRNYLPALLAFWPLSSWLTGSGKLPADVTHRAGRTIGALLILAVLCVFTSQNASIWGNEHDQAILWAELNPTSARAQVSAAMTEMSHGEAIKAERRLRPLLTRYPDQVQLAFNLIAARCEQGSVDSADLDAAIRSIRTTHDPGTLIVSWFTRAIATANLGQCKGFDVKALRKFISAAKENAAFPAGRRQDLLHLEGMLYLDAHDGMNAADAFAKALACEPRISVALEQAAELGSRGFPSLGLRHLVFFDSLKELAPSPPIGMPSVHAWILQRQDYWGVERRHLEETLRRDIANQPAKVLP